MGNDDLIFFFSSSESESYLPVSVGSCQTMAKTRGKSGRGLNALTLQLAFRDLQVFRFDWVYHLAGPKIARLLDLYAERNHRRANRTTSNGK